MFICKTVIVACTSHRIYDRNGDMYHAYAVQQWYSSITKLVCSWVYSITKLQTAMGKSTLMQLLCIYPYQDTCTATLPCPHHSHQQIANAVLRTHSRLCVIYKFTIICLPCCCCVASPCFQHVWLPLQIQGRLPGSMPHAHTVGVGIHKLCRY